MAEANAILDLNSMLSESMDSIPDAPDFSNPPAGEYILSTKNVEVDSYQAKEKNGVPAHTAQRLKITYAVVSTLSTADKEPPVADGTMFSETFMATEQGLSFFKARIKGIMGVEDVAGVTLADMMDSAKGAEFKCRITIRKSPKPGAPGEFYENLQIRVVK